MTAVKSVQRELDIKTADGTAKAWGYRPEGDAPVPGVLFFIDALLVRPSMHAMAARLAAKGYFVLLPNVFYRSGEIAPFDPNTVWGDEKERARLFKVLGAVSMEAAMKDAGAYLDAIAAQKDVRHGGAGVMGYCMGGRWAFSAAGHHGARIKACASIHGGNLITEKPDSPHLLADKITAKLYFGVADEDGSCTPEHQGALATTLGKAHLDYQIELYKGAKHGFAVDDMPVYDKAASERHWSRVETLFGATLT
jgi:carboxymethylenebutenolidase